MRMLVTSGLGAKKDSSIVVDEELSCETLQTLKRDHRERCRSEKV